MQTPDRATRIEELYHAAWAREPAERAAFLEAACAGDMALRREVESLLAQPATGDGRLDAPALAAAPGLLTSHDTPEMIGRQIGPYVVHALIGAGGMGEVYRARDTNLGRDVAIKILPRAFSADPERHARFEREARLLAALNHPHIASIHGVQDIDGVQALVLELVEGDTLSDRLARGPIPVREAMDIARQIADALDAAHEKSIVHRDLKPANIKITPDGAVKVLDFGLAKAMSGDSSAPDRTQSPTITVGGTHDGMILGTAAYMSPEQARGKAIDKRSDIWSFGCVLYEMLTGRVAFAGDTVSDTIAAILEREPKWSALPAATPAAIRRLLFRCCDKDVKRRLRDIGDARTELDDVLVGAASPSSASDGAATASAGRTRWLGWVVAALTAVAAVSWVYLREVPASPPPLPALTQIIVEPATLELGSGFAVSPDNRTLAFQAVGSDLQTWLWVRPMNSNVATPIKGSEGAGFQSIWWSPDSRFVAFAIGGTLKKFELATGTVQTICDVPLNIIGGTWNRSNVIVFGQGAGNLMRVDAGSSQPVRPVAVTRIDGTQHIHPFFLPDGVHFLYRKADADVYVGSLDAAPEAQTSTKILSGTQSGASYIPSSDSAIGHLLFMNEQTLFAQPFDERTLTPSGEAVPIAGPVATYFDRGLYSVTASYLVYRPGRRGLQQLAWYAPKTALNPIGDSGAITAAAVSPGGEQVAFTRNDIFNRGVLRLDLKRDVGEIRLTSDGTDDSLVWSGDSRRLAYRSRRGGTWKTYEQPASGEGQATVLLDTPAIPTSWSFDSHFLLHTVAEPKTGTGDVWVLSLEGERSRTPLLSGPSDAQSAVFSPNGRQVAYLDDVSGRREVYVRPFFRGSTPRLGEPTKVTNGGADKIQWSNDGRTLFYWTGLTVMAVEYTEEDTPARTFRPLGRERPHMSLPGGLPSRGLSADGSRALIIVPERDALQSPALAVQSNWQSLLPR